MLKVRCSLPSFRRILARRNMTAADYAHNRPQENPLGRHYSPFHNLQPCSFNDLQGAKAKNRCRIDEVRLEAFLCTPRTIFAKLLVRRWLARNKRLGQW